MAFKSRKIEYCIYPPNYDPYGSVCYKTAKTMKRAINLARTWGIGSEIMRNVERYYKDGDKLYYTEATYFIGRP